uniref:Chromo domain-containing protein n=1 Tax=Rhabditophanes sp. KR3021 TaxID=114890 RepID=A0AC35TIZ5_9BILA
MSSNNTDESSSSGGEDEFLVDRITDKKYCMEKGELILHYKVYWEGYEDSEYTWEPCVNLRRNTVAIEYEKSLLAKKEKSKRLTQDKERSDSSRKTGNKRKNTPPSDCNTESADAPSNRKSSRKIIPPSDYRLKSTVGDDPRQPITSESELALKSTRTCEVEAKKPGNKRLLVDNPEALAHKKRKPNELSKPELVPQQQETMVRIEKEYQIFEEIYYTVIFENGIRKILNKEDLVPENVNNNPSSINLSTTPTSAIAILIVTENKNDFDNYALALNSLECYTHHYGYTFKIIDFEANTTLAILCPQDDFFFARHCAVYHYLTDNQDTIQFLFTLDADIGVINPTITFERYLPADGEDIVFSQRIFTHEIAASPYIVRNSHKGRQFLLDWSQYFWRTPSSFHGSDNGALMQLFVDKYVTDQLRAKKNECQYIYETLSDFVTFRKYCICSASILYKVGDTTTNHLAILFGNGSVKVLKRLPFLSPVRDVWETNSRFCVDDFLLHGWKMNTMKPAYHNFGAWDSQLHTTTINISKCNGPAFVKQWKYKEHLIIPTSKVYQTLATVANNTNNEYSTSTFSQIKEKSLRRDRNIYVKSAYATVNGQTIVLFTAHKDAQFNQLKGENNINPVNNNIFPLISINPANYGTQTFHAVERSVLSNRMVSTTPDGLVSEKCHRQMTENTESKNYPQSGISATRFPSDFNSTHTHKDRYVVPGVELSPRQSEALSRHFPSRQYSESLTNFSIPEAPELPVLPENVAYGRYPEFAGSNLGSRKTSFSTSPSVVVSSPTVYVPNDNHKNKYNNTNSYANKMKNKAPREEVPISQHEAQPNAVMETVVSGPGQRRVGRWTLSQLRATDGIIPSQAGWNKGDSQKKMTNFGTPRNTQLNIKSENLAEIPEEIKLLSNGDVRLQSGTNKFCSQKGYTSFGAGRDVARESVKVNTNPADLPELSEDKIRLSEGIIRSQAGWNKGASQKNSTLFGTNRRETCQMVDTKHPEYDHTKPSQAEIGAQMGWNGGASQKNMMSFGTNRRETAKIIDEKHPEYNPETSIDQSSIGYQYGWNGGASQKNMTSFGQGRWEVLDPAISWQARASQGMVRLQAGWNGGDSQKNMTSFGTTRRETAKIVDERHPDYNPETSIDQSTIGGQYGWVGGCSQKARYFILPLF